MDGQDSEGFRRLERGRETGQDRTAVQDGRVCTSVLLLDIFDRSAHGAAETPQGAGHSSQLRAVRYSITSGV